MTLQRCRPTFARSPAGAGSSPSWTRRSVFIWSRKRRPRHLARPFPVRSSLRETGGLQSSDRIVPRTAYYAYLRALVENGFAKRIMFGSDFPDRIEEGIQALVAAPFLTARTEGRHPVQQRGALPSTRSGDLPAVRVSLTRLSSGDVLDFAWSADGARLAIVRATTTNDIVLFRGLR